MDCLYDKETLMISFLVFTNRINFEAAACNFMTLKYTSCLNVLSQVISLYSVSQELGNYMFRYTWLSLVHGVFLQEEKKSVGLEEYCRLKGAQARYQNSLPCCD